MKVVDGHTDEGPLIEPAIGVVPIGIVAEPEELHAPALAETFSTTEPDAPAMKVMPLVDWPPVIVPPLIVQLYVAPDIVGTEAMPLPFAQIVDEVVMVVSGTWVTFTVFEVLALHPPFVTVTL